MMTDIEHAAITANVMRERDEAREAARWLLTSFMRGWNPHELAEAAKERWPQIFVDVPQQKVSDD